MKSVPDRPRTGRGLTALRDRYIRRAEFLCHDREFLQEVSGAGRYWALLYPEFPITEMVAESADVFPWEWRHELSSNEYLRLRKDLDDGLRQGLMDERREFTHGASWWMIENDLSRFAFPLCDFYREPGDDAMTRSFIRACLKTDPRTLLGDLDSLFPVPGIELTMDMRPYWEQGIEPEEWEYDHPAQFWYIPVYPGITAKDLEAAIPAIIEQANRRLASRTVGARIEAMAAEGMTQQGIADALGLGVNTVQAHLRAVREHLRDAA